MKQPSKQKLLPILMLFLVAELSAKPHIISPLPLPKVEIVNLTYEPCDEACLRELDKQGEHFSFIARFHSQITNERLKVRLAGLMREYEIDIAPFEWMHKGRTKLRIALILPRKSIGRYSMTTIDTILAYLLARGGDFAFEVFNIQDEGMNSLQNALRNAKSRDFEQAIALLTRQGASEIAQFIPALPTYIPSVHLKQLNLGRAIPMDITFGGIDYEAQIEALMHYANPSKVVLYNDDSLVGRSVGESVKRLGIEPVFEESFSNAKATVFNQEIKKHGDYIVGASIFLNTPIVKSSLILSQFTYNNLQPERILSTQINYHHSLLSLTQARDRKQLYIANSIQGAKREIIEYSAVLKSDLQYDWINYSTALGVEFFYLKTFKETIPYFSESISDHSVQYPIYIYKSTQERFMRVD